MKKKLADVLWEAANVLNPVRSFCAPNTFTCVIVTEITTGKRRVMHEDVERCEAVAFMRQLGCPECATSVWGRIPDAEVQGVRYMWLLLAMHAAEDEGIMVEVAG